MITNKDGKIEVSSIPQMLQYNYAVDWHLDHIEDSLEHYRESYGLDLSPEFQRGHVWTMEQRIKFVEYILKGGKIYAPIIFNSPAFAGHRHHKDSDLDETVIIVDGLQRLTTMRMFMHNEVGVFGGYKLNDFDNPKLITRGFHFRVAVNTLQTRKELLQFYIELNEGHIAHSSEEIARVKGLLNKSYGLIRRNKS
jgi:hypothetical protein